MASARSTTTTGQAGEYLVAAELSRRGLIATTFTANVPHYDIVASDAKGRHAAIQVKAIRKASWHFNISHFCEIEFEDGRQIVGPKKREPVKRLVCVLVALREYGSDRFFVCSWSDLRDQLVAEHTEWLSEHGGRRPKNPKSPHKSLHIRDIEWCEDEWSLLTNLLG